MKIVGSTSSSVRHRIIERAEKNIAKAKFAQQRQDTQLVIETLPHARTDRIFAQRQIDQIGIDVAQFVELFLGVGQNGARILR